MANNYCVNKLVTDFDKTLTPEDTTYLIRDVIAKKNPNVFGLWANLENTYSKDYQAMLDKYFAEIGLQKPSIIQALENLNDKICSLENESLARAEPLLEGFAPQELIAAGRTISILPEARSTICTMKSVDVLVYVVSLSWSKELIIGALGDTIPSNAIYANRPVYEGHVAVGRLERAVMSPRDKLKFMNANRSQDETVAYVGDSLIDILCLRDAEYGFIVNPSGSLLKLLDKLEIGITTCSEKNINEEGLYLAASWKEIERHLRKK